MCVELSTEVVSLDSSLDALQFMDFGASGGKHSNCSGNLVCAKWGISSVRKFSQFGYKQDMKV
jgi:hypothetical protein